jgi:hypothetical protein
MSTPLGTGAEGLSAAPKNAQGAIDLYDAWADSYEDDLRAWGYAAPDITARLLHDLPLKLNSDQDMVVDQANIAVLDSGCGTGMSIYNIYQSNQQPQQV